MARFEPGASNRRDWLRDTARVAALGALGGGAALLLARNARIRASDCPRDLACSGCPKLAECALPERPLPGPEDSSP